MPTRSRQPDTLVDTSVAVALLLRDHRFHPATARVLRGRRLGMSGHAAFETFSVLTRLPAPARRSPAVVVQAMARNFPAGRYLSADGAVQLIDRLADGDIAGGSVYDALVGATAAEHGLPLATRDRRALDTYRAVGAAVEILPDQ